jgi:hypothetical protein
MASKLVMEKSMKPFGVVSTAVLFLLLGTPTAVYAQQEQQDDAKPRQQEEPKPTQQAKPARSQDTKPAQQEASKPEDRKEVNPAQKEQEERAQDETKKAQEEQTKPAQPQQRPPNGQSVAGNRSGGIPEDHFLAHFGREHIFVINRPVIVENRPRFQYSGYWFEIVDPWPVGWAYTDTLTTPTTPITCSTRGSLDRALSRRLVRRNVLICDKSIT